MPTNLPAKTDVSPLPSLLKDISLEGTYATQQQKFHTEDIKYVQNPVISADWMT